MADLDLVRIGQQINESALASACYSHNANEDIIRLGLKPAAKEGLVKGCQALLPATRKTHNGCND